MSSPKAVAMSASAMPPVIAVGAPSSLAPSRPKALILPVTVPNSPSSGASVTMVSSVARPPHSPAPIPVLTVHGAAGAKANS